MIPICESGKRASVKDSPKNGMGIGSPGDPMFTLGTDSRHAVAFGGNDTRGPIEIATALSAHGVPHGRLDFESETFIAFDTTQITHPENRCQPKPGDPCHPLTAHGHPRTIAFDCKAGGETGFSIGELPGALRGDGFGGGHAAVAIDLRNATEGDVAQTIQAAGIGTERGGNPNAIPHTFVGSAVRRLTPGECETLQGYRRGYTAITYRGKPAADGPRYRAIGNSMAVPIIRLVLERIEQFERVTRSAAA